jgi:hypothetical protein
MVKNPDTTNLPLFHDTKKNAFIIKGQKEKNVMGLVQASDGQIDTEIDKYVQKYSNRRKTGATELNATSSRSHAVFFMKYSQQYPDDPM